MKALSLAAELVLWVAIAMFTLVGASGVLLGPWEFSRALLVPLARLGDSAATLENQLRFLKALELAVGLFLWALRRDTFRDPRINRIVIATLTVTPLARLISCVMDGVPHPSLLLLMGVELGGALVVIVYSVLVFSRARRDTLAASSVTAASG